MSIKLKKVKKGQPGIKGGGAYTYHAAVEKNGKYNISQIADIIADDTGLDLNTTKKVLFSLIDNIPDLISNGNIVKVGDLGSFRLSIKSEGVSSPELLLEKHIKAAKVIFSPGSKLRGIISGINFKF